MKTTTVQHLMTEAVSKSAPDTPFSELVSRMRDGRHSCSIVTEKDMPVGIVTERDIVIAFASHLENNQGIPVLTEDIMSSPPVTVPIEATLFEALVISNSHHIRHLPVVNANGTLAGVLTYTDLVKAHFRLVDKSTESLNQAIIERNAELVAANERLQSLSLTDAMLDVGNRRAMEVDLQHAFDAAQRYKKSLAIMLVDIDHFKKYNDHYGHAAGDETLKQVASLLKAGLRNSERVYRYGGEEFLAILPESSLSGAVIAAERLLDSLEHLCIPHDASPVGQLSMSIGIAALNQQDTETVKQLVKLADEQLYAAKQAGRNTVKPKLPKSSKQQA